VDKINTNKKYNMKKSIFIFLFFFPVLLSAQIVKSGEDFTNVYLFDGKVVFLKEIRLKNDSIEKNYLVLREWMKENYSGDPLNSSIDFSKKRHAAKAISRVELLLPENSKGRREKLIMKYTLDSFITNNVCVMEISNISFINNKKANNNTLSDKIKAENMISDNALAIDDSNSETRKNTRKSVLFFLNELSHSLQQVYSY